MLGDAALERIQGGVVTDPLARAERILRAAAGDRVRTAFPLAPLTSFRLGGPAALYLEPESDADLAAAGEAIVATDVPFIVIGKGSNILVSDAGFPGLVLRLGRGYRWVAREGMSLTAGGSIPLPALAGVALRHGLAGLEFGVAIPATLGGAVRMNAGAHGGAMSQVLDPIATYRLRDGRAETVRGEDAGFAYRPIRPPGRRGGDGCRRPVAGGGCHRRSAPVWMRHGNGAAGHSHWPSRTAGACSPTRRGTMPPD